MVDYNKIQQEIENMKSGAIKWIGSNFELNDMQEIYHLLLNLESEGVIDIVAVGDLGAGKTLFSKGLAVARGV